MTQFTYGLTRTVGHGHAFTQRLAVAKPAAGVGFTIPADSRYWRVYDTIAFQLVTGGNAANRQVVLSILDGDGVAIATLPSASVQTASLTWQYTWATNFSTFNTVAALSVTSPLPYTFLPPGFSVSVAVGAVDAADQISNIRAMAEQFVTGPQGYVLGTLDSADYPEADLARLATLGA